MIKAVFFDKDGTLIRNVPYNVDPGKIRLSPHAVPCLQILRDLGYKLFVISNQQGVANGYFEEAALEKVSRKINDLLEPYDIRIDAFYYCPHHPAAENSAYRKICNCRKPLPGLLHRAAYEHQIDLPASWMVGDILNDVEAGNRAGCKTILLDNGNETQWQLNQLNVPRYVAGNLWEVACVIVRHMFVRDKTAQQCTLI